MLGKQRLAIGVSYGRLSVGLAVRKELVWAIVPPLLLALTFLSLVLLRPTAKDPTPVEGTDMRPPAAADTLFSHYADWRQTDESYLSIPPVLR